MRILKRPMFKKGGSANSGIMDGLDRGYYANGGTIGGGMITGTPMGYRTGFEEPTLEDIITGKKAQLGTQYTEDYIKEMYDQYVQRLENPEFYGGVGSQVPITPSIKEQSILELIETQPDKAYEMFKSGELGGFDYATEQAAQAEAFTGGGIKFDKFDFKTKGPEVITAKEPPDGTQLPYVKKDDGGLDGVTIADAKQNISDLNKERMKLFAPHMQKRMMADAWGAASEAFGKSTGDTKQDIANAISAAAKGMGGTQNLADKISMLTLQGEIMKDVEKAKTQKVSNYEFLYNKAMSKNPKDRAWAKDMLKQDKDLGSFVEVHGTDKGYRLFVGKTMPDIKGTFAGDDKSLKELKTEELEDGKYYLGPPKDEFITIEGGKITKREPGLV